MINQQPVLAKLTWTDPNSGELFEFLLHEGATVTIGRLESNDICIKEQHVSRQHAVISYRDGVYLVTDLGSANGAWVNDKRLTEPYPMVSGDELRLYVPTLRFLAVLDDDDLPTGATLVAALENADSARLVITNGPQEGNTVPLSAAVVTVGRATTSADWEIELQDPSVSRPHARLELHENSWRIFDLGSANGTLINGTHVNEKGRLLRDGDVITFGATMTLFRNN